MTQDDNAGKSRSIASDPVGQFVAGTVLVFFALLVWYMLDLLGDGKQKIDDLTWTRALYIFGGIEAVAFSAAGYLFGREVNRQRAEKAEEKADREGQVADKAIKDASASEANGRSLVKMIRLKSDKREMVATGKLESAAEAMSAQQDDLQELLLAGEQLFPNK